MLQRENIFTIPNVLCVARIAMSPYLGYVILQDNYNLALGLLVFAGFTDLVRNSYFMLYISFFSSVMYIYIYLFMYI